MLRGLLEHVRLPAQYKPGEWTLSFIEGMGILNFYALGCKEPVVTDYA